MNRTVFPTVYAMAMDYLPIQATSVPSERVFSSSSDTDSKKRNRIAPVLFEALQILKSVYKEEALDFTSGWSSTERQILSDMEDSSVPSLQGLLSSTDAPSLQLAVDDIVGFLIDEDEDEIVEDDGDMEMSEGDNAIEMVEDEDTDDFDD